MVASRPHGWIMLVPFAAAVVVVAVTLSPPTWNVEAFAPPPKLSASFQRRRPSPKAPVGDTWPAVCPAPRALVGDTRPPVCPTLRAAAEFPSEDDGGDALEGAVVVGRRSALVKAGCALAAASFAAAAVGGGVLWSSPRNGDVTTTTTTTTTTTMAEVPSSVAEALELIESRGDRRFVHAVVASGYRFLYEPQLQRDGGSSPAAASSLSPSLSPLPPSLAGVALSAFSKLPPSVSDPQSSSSSAVLAGTGRFAGQTASSLWPLAGRRDGSEGTASVHYAWPSGDSGALLARGDVIVDGVDCGKMALEDALEGDMQMLVFAPSFLVVPRSMEAELRTALRGAFLM